MDILTVKKIKIADYNVSKLIPFTDYAQNARSVVFELLFCGLVSKGPSSKLRKLNQWSIHTKS